MIRALLVLMLSTLLALPASATRIRKMSLDEIRDQASSIVVVEVRGSSVRSDASGLAWTDYQIRVEDVLRGSHRPGELLTLAFAGGRTGVHRASIEGVPLLTEGSRLLLFLDEVPGRPVPVVGWSQGIFRIEQSERAVRFISTDESRIVVSDSGAVETEQTTRLALRDGARRLPDPLAMNADGTVAVQVASRNSNLSLASRARDASLEDLRRFCRDVGGPRDARSDP